MMSVVTGWSPSGYEQYGRRFLSTFDKFWPKCYDLYVYVEEFFPMTGLKIPLHQIKLSDIPGCLYFINKYRTDMRANGRQVEVDWKPKCKAEGYNYKYDAWKFCRQGFIPYHLAAQLKTELMCWLDGDVVTEAAIPEGFIESLLPADSDLAYLGRPGKHSEIGFQLYRLPESAPMLQMFSYWYSSEGVFSLKEWHSAYVFDTARNMSGVRSHNLTPNGTGHVWHQSPLTKYMDHLKGKRK